MIRSPKIFLSDGGLDSAHIQRRDSLVFWRSELWHLRHLGGGGGGAGEQYSHVNIGGRGAGGTIWSCKYWGAGGTIQSCKYWGQGEQYSHVNIGGQGEQYR